MEIDEIEQKVMREREKYKQVTQTKPDALTLLPNIEINDKVILRNLIFNYSKNLHISFH